jgi:hypothetical protein
MEPEILQNKVLDCSEILCRLALKKAFMQDKPHDAFLLRPSDQGKLSVYRLARTTQAECSATLRNVQGAFSLHTGHVRNATEKNLPILEVIEDESPEDNCPGHASILNLPDPQTDYERAQRSATLLSRISRKLP